jgi:hypothetical protein
LINNPTSLFTTTTHPQLKELELIELKAEDTNASQLIMALQSTRDTTIIEKGLSAEEVLYLPNANIIAMSS